MPKRNDLQTVLILGAGPIVIGQACEFDYSGTQACKALKEENCRVVLVNSNPATIMTDPVMADATYIEPLRWETLEKIIAEERPDAILPTMGGQTALNCALDLESHGILEKYNCELIGANAAAINKAEDRYEFDKAMRAIGLETPRAKIANNIEQAWQALDKVGMPCIIRPSFTMGGSGGGIAYNRDEFLEICQRGLELSPTSELLIDESLIGWKEFEMEVVRDKNDNCIIICCIENLDPLGIHTGDSITVAPAQTLTDKEYQLMRNASIAVLREIGVETGGSNVQFGLNPKDGRMVVIEMNPRVSRSSALASKATGFPIAKVATKLALGYTLDELENEMNAGVPASFEPAIDYVVTKIPRFAFEKFPAANDRLTTQMKSVGEVMAIGRNFQESLQKALRGLEVGACGLNPIIDIKIAEAEVRSHLSRELTTPGCDRIWYLADAMRFGFSLEKLNKLTGIDPWFLEQIHDLIQEELSIKNKGLTSLSHEKLYQLKRKGFSDQYLAALLQTDEAKVRKLREHLGVLPIYKRVDTCAAEFSTTTAYLYSSYDEESEADPTENEKIIILGGGPNRIGQGIEFDYCCVHASLAMKELGYETIMVNCNPETVSTDYDTSDRLYFEPLTLEDVLAIVSVEKPKGVIVQYGGQTPLRLAQELAAQGVPIIGTSPEAIDRAEDRERFQAILHKLDLLQPKNATVRSISEALKKAQGIGFPLVVRPSYVLGGRAMEIVYNEQELETYMQEAVQVSSSSPVLLDSFLDSAIEVDIDVICDGKQAVIGAIMQHIEPCGVHSGDSACVLPPYSLSVELQDKMRAQVKAMALELGVVGLMNAQLAVKEGNIYVIEVNPRASRTVPFASKAIGHSLAKVAAKVMAGRSLQELDFCEEIIPPFFSVKEAVFPFNKFPGVDPILGPEMRSTGEVMGFGQTLAEAYNGAQLAVGHKMPRQGRVILSMKEADKYAVPKLGKMLWDAGFELYATEGTANVLKSSGIKVEVVSKCTQSRPDIVDKIKNDEVVLVLNTTDGRQALADSKLIRSSALEHKVLYSTTLAGAQILVESLVYKQTEIVRKVQNLYHLATS